MSANQAQREAWDGDSGRRWAATADRRDRSLAPVADALFAAAGLRPGEDVLDLGCGCGVTTIAAADLVAPGTVTAVDLSGPMLDIARRRAGDRSVTFVQTDAQTHAFETEGFDVAISRFGTMFFDDPRAAFANVAGAMRSGGRLCIATWQVLAANEWLAMPAAMLAEHGQLPKAADGSAPGMFAQADPDRVRDVLTAAGWKAVEVRPVGLRLRLGADANEALDYVADTSIARAVLETIDPDRREGALDAVRAELARRESPDGVELGAGINVVTAAT